LAARRAAGFCLLRRHHHLNRLDPEVAQRLDLFLVADVEKPIVFRNSTSFARIIGPRTGSATSCSAAIQS
jgi:hypothetical protein